MQTMYPGKVNSPATTLDGGINNTVTTIDLIDGSVLPIAPNIAVIGTGEDSETILYATKVGNQLSNITRGFQGIAKSWSTGEAIARLFTEYDYGALKGNIGTIAGRKISDFAEVSSAELAGKISDEIGTGKIVLCEEGTWTPELKFGGNSVGITYNVQSGDYIKIGRKLSVTCYFTISSKGTSTGNATINGLPFACKTGLGAYSAPAFRLAKITFASVYQGEVNVNATNISLNEVTEAGNNTTLTHANFISLSSMILTATYFTN